jgi:ketosteroid isomerase-like protein
MASANVELVRSIYSAWQRADLGSLEWAHPDIEHVLADGPSPGSWKGVQAASTSWRDFLSAWEDFRFDADEYRELDEEHVLVLNQFIGRGKTSGLDLGPMRAKGAHLFHIRDGKVTTLVSYFDRDHAFADLGLAREGIDRE